MRITNHADGTARRPVMTRGRWLGLAVSSAAAVAVIAAGSSAMAASGGAHGTNYRTAPVAAAQQPRALTPATTTVHYYSLAASAFAPDGVHSTSADYFNQWNPSTLSDNDPSRCFNAGLSLPDGAHLQSVTLYYTGSTVAMYFDINQQMLATHSSTELISLGTTPVTTPAYSSVTKNFPTGTTVHMAANAYSAGACPSGATTFTGLTIKYTS